MSTMTKAQMSEYIQLLEAANAAAGVALNPSSEDSELQVIARKNVSAKVKDVHLFEKSKSVDFTLDKEVILYQKERDENDFTITDSNIAPRKTKHITVKTYDLHAMAVRLGIAKLRTIAGGITSDVLTAFFNATVWFDINPYSVGDEYKAYDGTIRQHARNGADVKITKASLNPKDVEEAIKFIKISRTLD